MKFVLPSLASILILISISCKKKDVNTNKDNPIDIGINIDTIKVRTSKITDLGALTMPPHLVGRDGGHTTIISGKLIWIFGDSFFDQRGVDGMQYRTNTSTQSSSINPLVTSEPVDALGVSYQFIPFTIDEKKFNDSTNSPTDRIGLWPTGIFTTDNVTAIILYTKVYLKSPWQDFGIGIAKYKIGDVNAVRNNGLLFKYPESNMQTPFLHGDHLYIYGASRKSGSEIVCRAKVSQLENRNAYEFWDGSQWVKDMNAAKGISSQHGGSYSFNKYYNLFLHIYGAFGQNAVYISFARNPQGPWSKGQVLLNTEAPTKEGYNYIIIEHPDMAKDDGKTIYISYSHPLPSFLAGEIRLLEVKFM